MNRKDFFKNLGIISGALFIPKLLTQCAENLTDLPIYNEKEIKNKILFHLDNSQRIGYYELYPHIFRQKRMLLIVDNYYFDDNDRQKKAYSADYILGFDVRAIVKCNFDFYKTNIHIKEISNERKCLKNGWEYIIKTYNPDEKIYFRMFSTIIKITYPVKLQNTDDFSIVDELALPCIMSCVGFQGFLSDKNWNTKLALV